jgi:hypothetical protein
MQRVKYIRRRGGKHQAHANKRHTGEAETTRVPHLRVASIALSRPTILKLLPRPSLPRISPAAGINVSSQCLNTAFISRGTPSMTTVVTGMKGRSSSDTARMPYSCAKRRAVEKALLCVRERAPMMLMHMLVINP